MSSKSTTIVYVNANWTDEAAFTADTTKPEGLTWNTDAFGTLDALFAAELTGDVNVNLMGNISTANQVNVSYTKDVKYHFKTNVEGGATMSMSYDNWNCLPHFSIAEDVTLNVTYLQMVGGDAEISGTINTHYLYMYGTGEGVTVESTGKIVVEGEDKTIQVKGGTVFTVYGEVSTSTLNVWTQDSNASTMIISGANASVTASHIHAWDGGNATDDQKITVKDGATLTVTNIQADRDSTVKVDNATLEAQTMQLGYDTNTGTLEIVNGGTVSADTSITVSSESAIALDSESQVSTASLSNQGEITVDGTNFTEGTIQNVSATAFTGNVPVVENVPENITGVASSDGAVFFSSEYDCSKILINDSYVTGTEFTLDGIEYKVGVNAFANVNDAEAVAEAGASKWSSWKEPKSHIPRTSITS